MTVLVVILLAAAVVAAGLGALAVHRVQTPLERLHAGSFVAIASTTLLVAAAFATDGLSGRSLKMVLILVVLTVSGAATNHAIGRALLYRGGERR